MNDQAYFVSPEAGPGPGVLLLPSWWGLTGHARRRADLLADAGFAVLAPDLTFGQRPESEAEAKEVLERADPNRLASLVMSSSALLMEKAAGGPIGVVGFGMGGSLGLWLAVRRPDAVSAVASFYGSQAIDFAGAEAAVLVHLAEQDEFISDDEAVFMEATLGLEEIDVTVIRYSDTSHGFANEEGPTFAADAAERAWAETVEFLSGQLRSQ